MVASDGSMTTRSAASTQEFFEMPSSRRVVRACDGTGSPLPRRIQTAAASASRSLSSCSDCDSHLTIGISRV